MSEAERSVIRSLDIGPRERWTRGRLPIHMAIATASQSALPRPPKRRERALWKILVAFALVPPVAALSVIAALALLRRGL